MTKPANPFWELNRLFERMQRNIEEAEQWWGTTGTEWKPGSIQIDLEDTDDELVLTADLPGFEAEDIDVRLTDRTLKLEAEHEEETAAETEGEYVRRERRRASVSRSVSLPEAVEREEISASYRNGVLTVRMPKREPVSEGTAIEIE